MSGDLRDVVLETARHAGLAAVGIASAEPFDDTRALIEERRAAGLHGGMAFTFRNPARSTDPTRTLPGAQSLVVGAYDYRRTAPDVESPDEGVRGVVARYSWEDHYAPLRAALTRVAEALHAAGWRAKVLVDDNALVDRAAAHRAGLGWYGKNANLLLPDKGSWFVLGSVVTDARLRPTSTAPLTTEAGCGACTRCLSACPTGALVAPGVLDARRCLAWLLEAPGVFPREHRIALGGRIYGCDECQEVCPPNRLEERRAPGRVPGDGSEPWIDLVLMLAMSDDDLIEHFGRWYIPRRDPAYLRRNALVALANVADGADRRVAAALCDALADPSEVVRAHAVWAAARLGRRDLLDLSVTSDTSPLVSAELGALPDERRP